ncbi:MAG: hypothetical protein KJ963_08680 [Bacteroidetes bacterium]|nr:hypothetical protein [Bacteroidota bacterium]MBU2637142.1 hypothetical protein [Bacteroidota bacterium]
MGNGQKINKDRARLAGKEDMRFTLKQVIDKKSVKIAESEERRVKRLNQLKISQLQSNSKYPSTPLDEKRFTFRVDLSTYGLVEVS